MIGYRCLSVLLGLAFGTTFANAQQAWLEPEPDHLYEMARNTVGLLRYCKQHDLLDAKTADEAIEGALGGVTAVSSFRETPISKQAGDNAEKNGEAGLWGTARKPMEQLAQSYVLTPYELCKQWADTSVESRARTATTNQP
jgi:hypothetical protein